jgi:hypothetical protein
MPGDVVLGTQTGILFIPPHLAQAVVEHSERTHLREMFSHSRLREGIYSSSQMDTQWTDAIKADFYEWLKTNTPEGYGPIDWAEPKPEPERKSEEETTLG